MRIKLPDNYLRLIESFNTTIRVTKAYLILSLLVLTGCMVDFSSMVIGDQQAKRSNIYEKVTRSGGTLCQRLGQRAIINVNKCSTINCEGHLAGASWAHQTLQKTGGWPNSCTGKSRSFTEGCQAYVFSNVDQECTSGNAYIVD